jgi:hypothetical protein
MPKTPTYYLHQTPADLARDLVATLDFAPTDVLCEPFKGEGAFFNAFPAANPTLWAELEEGRDYTSIEEPFDWVITNPPFCLDTSGKRINAFWQLLDYYTQRSRKGIALLANDTCFCTLTPRRMEILKDRGWAIHKVIVCSVKKWRGRYFFMVFKREPTPFFTHLQNNY